MERDDWPCCVLGELAQGEAKRAKCQICELCGLLWNESTASCSGKWMHQYRCTNHTENSLIHLFMQARMFTPQNAYLEASLWCSVVFIAMGGFFVSTSRRVKVSLHVPSWINCTAYCRFVRRYEHAEMVAGLSGKTFWMTLLLRLRAKQHLPFRL